MFPIGTRPWVHIHARYHLTVIHETKSTIRHLQFSAKRSRDRAASRRPGLSRKWARTLPKAGAWNGPVTFHLHLNIVARKDICHADDDSSTADGVRNLTRARARFRIWSDLPNPP